MTQPISIVTGANGNLGSAVVHHLETNGLRVAKIEHGKLTLDGNVLHDIDLADGSSVRRAFAVLGTRGFELRSLIHTVGTFRSSGPLTETPDSDFLELFQINVLTTVHVVQSALALMIPAKRGRIAVVSGVDALKGRAQSAPYAASKAAQLRMVDSAAQELRGTGVTLNAVLPGLMDTPQNRAAMPHADPKSWVKLEEVASVLAFLISDGASGIQGQAIRVERS
jgi:NAD(P)-dependent dehydrogenase (short-subunit alcohol dehydrogenase family)